MRILLIHQFFLEDDEGGGSRWNEMSRIWTEAGHELTVLAGMTHYMGKRKNRYQGRYFHTSVNKDQVKVIRCYVRGAAGSFTTRVLSFISFVISGIFGGLLYAGGKYDIILVTSPPLFDGLIGLFLAWWKKIPFVFEVRDLWPESAIETGVLKNKYLIRLAYRFEAYVYKRAKLINVLTPAFREVLIDKKNIPAAKIIKIPNGADFVFSEELLTSFDTGSFRKLHDLEGKFVIVYVGAHGIANHLIQVFDTAALLLDTNVLFLLIGSGEQKEALKKEALVRKLPNVRFIDAVSKKEVFKYILASDMGTSVLKKTEIFKTIYSNKTFDYFSCKKPVLMVIDGISRKLVEDAGAGIFVEPENPEDYAGKIRYYLNHPELCKRQGENGYQYVRESFDREALAKVYLDHLTGIV
jgi:glycosyltransferase involved in cell wall biosynthesis